MRFTLEFASESHEEVGPVWLKAGFSSAQAKDVVLVMVFLCWMWSSCSFWFTRSSDWFPFGLCGLWLFISSISFAYSPCSYAPANPPQTAGFGFCTRNHQFPWLDTKVLFPNIYLSFVF
jgi:hypothetical protein